MTLNITSAVVLVPNLLTTRRGMEAKIIHVLTPPDTFVGGRTVIAQFRVRPGADEWQTLTLYPNGRFYPGDRDDEYDLVEVVK